MTKKASVNGLVKFLSVISILNLAIVIFLVFQSRSDQQRIAYIDEIQLLGRYKGMESAKKELNDKSNVWSSNLETLKKEMESAYNNYQHASKNISKSEEELLEATAKQKQQQFINYKQMID